MRRHPRPTPVQRRVVTALLALTGCPEPELCTTEAVAGIVVTVQDALSHAPVCNATVVLTTREGYEDRPTAMGEPCTYAGAYEQPGRFTVEVTATGYATARRENVVVTQDNCHVVPQPLTVDLVPR
ncbi:MAG: carboxypeptidase regulatory-like domain-containing protein [Deltaproteobacteria bacterium]|nr:carboxypeptidase regulatory-like domain-containing protein [Deltaproteobacteria bacterium]